MSATPSSPASAAGAMDAPATHSDTAASPSIRRTKICLLGSSRGGKTSLVKSITLSESKLVDEKDRTIGIDLYPFFFTDAASQQRHEIVFWDFAGQDVYQVANALFFSSRTLYLLCVDLDVYAHGLSSAEKASEWDRDAITQRFVEQQVFRWARLIFARQPDANLVVVGTKSDLLAADQEKLKLVERDLQIRISEWCRAFAQGMEKSNPLLERARQFYKQRSLIVSMATQTGVDDAKHAIENLCISHTSLGLPMSTSYLSVLNTVQQLREEAKDLDGYSKMKQLIRRASKLQCELITRIPGVKQDEILSILRDFHDQGEILWYDHENAGAFRNFIILDPVVVLDIVRELINHNYETYEGPEYEALRDRGEVKHSLLMSFSTWKAVSEAHEDLVYMFKLLMSFYQLAYPVGSREMTATSDLIVPTYWKSKKLATGPGALIKNESMLRREQLPGSFTGYWQYSVPAELSEAIFDQFIVQSHSYSFTRTVTATHVAITQSKFAGRIFYEEGKHESDNIRIEIVASSDVICWTAMRFFVLSMEIVLEAYPGLNGISRDILHRDASTEESYALEFAIKDYEDARRLGYGLAWARQSKPWLPPNLDWFVSKVWKNPNALAQMEMSERERETELYNGVIKKLAASSDRRRTLPALFTIRATAEKPRVFEVQLLSDLSGVCHHEPIHVTIPEADAAKYTALVQVGVSVFSTVTENCLTEEILREVLEMGRAGLVEPVEHSRIVHNRTGLVLSDLSRPDTVDTTSSATLLRSLLTHHDRSSDEITVMMRSNLACVLAKAAGVYVWASERELQRVDNIENRKADVIRQEVESFKRGLNPVVSQASASRLKYFLKITGAHGVPKGEWNKAICSWELRRPQKLIEEGDTEPFTQEKLGTKSDPTKELVWSDKFPLTNISSHAALRDCQLDVKIKRRRHWLGSPKVICQGSLLLSTILEEEKRTSTLFSIKIQSCRDCPAVTVEGMLLIEEQSMSSRGA